MVGILIFANWGKSQETAGLMDSGMGKGPALALLLAGPALSLPNMLVIRSFMGTQKTIVFVCLVVIMATMPGVFFGVIS